MWKGEFGSNKIRHLTEEISKQICEFEALFLLAAYSKMQKNRDQMRKEWLSTEEPGLDHLGTFRLFKLKRTSN